MKLAIVGVSHKTAPVALREQLALGGAHLADALRQLSALPQVAEGAILSTCNRVELYLAGHDPEAAAAAAAVWLAERHSLDHAVLAPHLYIHLDGEAVSHGLRVAASLDSMVVGEPQILGQLKAAYQEAVAAGCTGMVLNKYFHHAFRVAKRVRSETAIAENAVSVSFAAVELAKRIFGRLEGHTCLLIGAGEMCELAARHLVGAGVARVLVTNRTLARAVELAQTFDGHALPLEELADALEQADIILSSTGSPVYLVGPEMVKTALKRRRQRPMFFIDIAVPRDLDPRIGQLDSAFLYDIDDLNQVVEQNRRDRGQAAEQAETIIAQEAPQFLRWLGGLQVVPTLVELRQRLELLRDQEVEKAIANWPGLDEAGRERLRQLARLLVNKILHDPTTQIRHLAAQEDGDLYLDAARKLFRLGGDEAA